MKKLNKTLKSILVVMVAIFTLLFLIYLPAKTQTNLVIDASQKYQIIEGFGGHISGDRFGEYSGYESTSLWDLIVNDLRLSFVRFPISPGFEQDNDNNDSHIFNWDIFDASNRVMDIDHNNQPCERPEVFLDLKALLKLKEHGMKNFVATPYIAFPYWMTENKSLWYSGGVASDMYEEFGEFVSAFIHVMKRDYDLEIKYFSPYCEPEVGAVMGVSFGPSKYQDLIRVVKKRFQYEYEQGYEYFGDMKIVAPVIGQPEAITKGWALEGNPEEMPDIYAWDQYGRDCIDLYNYCTQHKFPNWQLETSALGENGEPFMDGIRFAIYIHESLVNAESTAWFWYCIWLPSYISGYNIIAVSDDLNNYVVGAKYYAIRQFSHYIQPGSRRIQVVGGAEPAYERGPFLYGGIFPSAYVHPDGTFTMVIINDTANSKSTNIVINNLEVESLEKIRFSSSENSQRIGNITVSGNSFTDTLPAYSVTTYTTQSSNLPPVVDVTPPMPPTGVRVNNP